MAPGRQLLSSMFTLWRRGAHPFDGHLAYLPHWLRVLISMSSGGGEGDPVVRYFIFFIVEYITCLEKVYWSPRVSHLPFFRPVFFTPSITGATTTHLSHTTYLCFQTGQFLCCHLLGHMWESPRPFWSRRWEQVCEYFHLHSFECSVETQSSQLFTRTEPQLSTNNQLDNSPLNRLPSFLLHPPHCAWTSLFKINCSRAGLCLNSAFEKPRLRQWV